MIWFWDFHWVICEEECAGNHGVAHQTIRKNSGDLLWFTSLYKVLPAHTHTRAHTETAPISGGYVSRLVFIHQPLCKLATAGCTPHTPHHGRFLACKLPTCGWMISWWSYFVLFLNFESQYVPLFLSPKSRCVKYITRRYYYSLTFTNLKCCIRDEFPY